MKCEMRKWKLSDAKDLAIVLSNRRIQDNLRDGLPYPYTEQDGADYISAMLSANEDEIFAFAITADNKGGNNGAWLQIGCKNFENTEQINILRKSNDRKPRKYVICHTRFSQSNP